MPGIAKNRQNRRDKEMIEVLLSECCGSPPWFETGLCSSCKEHADFIDIIKKEKENAKARTDNAEESKRIHKATS